MGIDMKTKNELVAAHADVTEICKIIEADSLGYLSMEGLLKVCAEGSEGQNGMDHYKGLLNFYFQLVECLTLLVTSEEGEVSEAPALKRQKLDKAKPKVRKSPLL